MKKTLLAFLTLTAGITLSAQCSMQVACNWVTCYGACDGTAMAYVVNAAPPYSFQWMPGGQTTQTITGLCAGTYTCVMVDSLGCMATAQCTVGSPQQLQATITTIIPPSCQSCCDGSATGSATGGTPPYTFMWGPPPTPSATMNGMCVGTYTFCVYDGNGCQSCTTITQQLPQSVIAANEVMAMTILPNPADDKAVMNCSFQNAASGEIVVTNILGEIIGRTSFDATLTLQTEIDLSEQPSGLYFVSVITASGTTSRRISHN